MNTKTMICRLVAAGLLLGGASVAQADTLRCESRNNGYTSCPADTRNGVTLTQQLSSQGCWQGDTWGYDRNRIWVNRGCRAEFRVGGGSSSNNGNKVAAAVVVGLVAAAIIADKNKDHHDDRDRYDDRYDDRHRPYYGDGGYPARTFRCESRDNRYAYCSIPGRGHVEVYKQLSSSACRYGDSWGVEGSRVWVSDGCRAEFAVY